MRCYAPWLQPIWPSAAICPMPVTRTPLRSQRGGPPLNGRSQSRPARTDPATAGSGLGRRPFLQRCPGRPDRPELARGHSQEARTARPQPHLNRDGLSSDALSDGPLSPGISESRAVCPVANAVGARISMKEKIIRKMRRRVTTALLDIITKTILKSTRAQNSVKI